MFFGNFVNIFFEIIKKYKINYLLKKILLKYAKNNGVCKLMRKFITYLTIIAFCFACVSPAFATKKLSPADFNYMYGLAADGDLSSLMSAANRGLDLDATNKNGDSGVCIAIKKNDYKAYNTFIKAGAHEHPRCLNFISKSKVESFMESSNTIKYSEYPSSFVPRDQSVDWWIAGAFSAVIVVLAWLITHATKG